MKKISLVIIALYSISAIHAQIVINQSDICQVGNNITMLYDTTGPNLSYGGTGSGLNWDFSTATINLQYQNNITAPAGNVKSHLFPTATAAISFFNINTQYYENSASEIRHLATVVNILDSAVHYYDYAYLKYPAQMGSTHSEMGSGNLGVRFALGLDPDQTGPHPFVDSIGTMTTHGIYSNIDAEGTVKTPHGEYDAIRQYTETYYIDSAYMYAGGKWQPMSQLLRTLLMQSEVTIDTTFAYAWLAKNKQLPVANVEFEPSGGNILVVQWQLDSVVTSQKTDLEMLTREVGVYPQPATEVIRLEWECNITDIAILDMKGALIRNIAGNNHKKQDVNVSALKSGQYILEVKNTSEGIVQRRRIQIQ